MNPNFNQQRLKLTVIDSVMGSGKSTFAINHINSTPNERYVVIVPTRAEVQRYAKDITRADFVFPNLNEKLEVLDSPKDLQGQFRGAITSGKSIVATHALLEAWNEETIEVLKHSVYTLILDEAIELLEPFAGFPSAPDYDLLTRSRIVREEPQESGLILIRSDTGFDDYFTHGTGKHQRFLAAVREDTLYRVPAGGVVWYADSTKLKLFKDVVIMTYLFDGSVMGTWVEKEGLPVQYKHVRKGVLHDGLNPGGGSAFKDLITLVECPKLNSIGIGRGKLSATYFKKAGVSEQKAIRSSIEGFFRRFGATPETALWSCYREPAFKVAPAKFKAIGTHAFQPGKVAACKPAERAARYTWVPTNIKATNDYRHKTHVAFVANTHAFPLVESFFYAFGLKMQSNRYSLSEMLQVIWRSAIREGNPITLYVPSERMRSMLKEWIDAPI